MPMKCYCCVSVLDLRFQSHLCVRLVERTCVNCDAYCYYSLFVMIIFLILMVQRVAIVARCYSCSKQF